MSRRVVMSLMFFPRGGSAQVARYMARSLPDAGWDVTLVAGGPRGGGGRAKAGAVFQGRDGAPGGGVAGGSRRAVDRRDVLGGHRRAPGRLPARDRSGAPVRVRPAAAPVVRGPP